MRRFDCLLCLVPALFLVLAACGSDDSGSNCADEDLSVATNAFQYVVDEATVPTSALQALQVGLDLDDDDNGRVDNRLGEILGILAGQNIDVQAAVGSAITEGDIIILTELKATDLADGCGSVGVYLGANPDPAACDPNNPTDCGKHLSGSASFEIAPGIPNNTEVIGTLASNRFLITDNDTPGNFSIELDLIEGQDAITLDLIGARVEIGSISANGLSNGLIGGAVKTSDLETTIIPTMQNLLNDELMTACDATQTPCCPANSNGELILNLFDSDDSCTISVAEITQNQLIGTLLTPDVDLLDAAGNYQRDRDDRDGNPDSLSIGIGFGTTTATFTAP